LPGKEPDYSGTIALLLGLQANKWPDHAFALGILSPIGEKMTATFAEFSCRL